MVNTMGQGFPNLDTIFKERIPDLEKYSMQIDRYKTYREPWLNEDGYERIGLE